MHCPENDENQVKPHSWDGSVQHSLNVFAKIQHSFLQEGREVTSMCARWVESWSMQVVDVPDRWKPACGGTLSRLYHALHKQFIL